MSLHWMSPLGFDRKSSISSLTSYDAGNTDLLLIIGDGILKLHGAHPSRPDDKLSMIQKQTFAEIRRIRRTFHLGSRGIDASPNVCDTSPESYNVRKCLE